MASYTVQSITEAGVAASFVAVGASDTFTPAASDYDKAFILQVKNAGGSPDSVVVDDPNTLGPAGATAFNPDVTVSVPATTGDVRIRLAPIRRYLQSNGTVAVTHSFTTTVTANVFTY
jgi:hypothetical protein